MYAVVASLLLAVNFDYTPPALLIYYHEALAESKRSHRPIVVWVGCDNVHARSLLPEFLHTRVESFEGDSSPRVIIGIPMTDGRVMYRGSCTPKVGAIELKLHEKELRRWLTPAPVVAPLAPPIPMQTYMPIIRGSRGGSC